MLTYTYKFLNEHFPVQRVLIYHTFNPHDSWTVNLCFPTKMLTLLYLYIPETMNLILVPSKCWGLLKSQIVLLTLWSKNTSSLILFAAYYSFDKTYSLV